MTRNIHKLRFSKFGISVKDLPNRTVIRKSSAIPLLFWSIVVLGIVVYFFYKSQILHQKINFVGIALQSTIILGFLLRSLFLFAVPQLILNMNGIKFPGKKQIRWKSIDYMTVKEIGGNETVLKIILENGIRFTEILQNNGKSAKIWRRLIKSYFFKFR